ncbi:hypothetical protein N7495_003383 [Penicillium taxi]|uniref:uncharacterized protein n=1 Tax=Penicillium taxi TaxID=168475 RepID=UPI0025457F6D|nr:uncharacterized protein N7495_003383 [Penicillium taxi]KAJ5902855.1 hypothetical protein N7495_003383 [Penicillium taxi]
MSISTSAPFPPSCALNRDPISCPSSATNQPSQIQSELETIHHLPGNPAVSLRTDEVHGHLLHELATPLLDELYAHLWLVAKKSGLHIDALHRQRVKRRPIIPTEDPKFHLVWSRDKIYIKPVPLFLLNHDFWVRYLQPPRRLLSSEHFPFTLQTASWALDRSIAMGFMRSYALLVRYPLDLAIAKESFLIPREVD